MKATKLAIPDIILIEPRVFNDDRGFFFESYNQQILADILPPNTNFVQDNHSRSKKNVLRGLHFQSPYAQGKLLRTVVGEIYDVAVDLRRDSAHYGQSVGVRLSSENKQMLWIPPGFAHGFLVLSDSADLLYKTTEYWYGEAEFSLKWDDPDLAINWPLDGAPILSAKDAAAQSLVDLTARAGTACSV
ncbi:MAG: dTDP-4-dehydrorhamnose 3,5-epimerase [Alphaproteobacteria bacterium]|nr:dTDP-4-dehydrorhamnose 3,5-epimerase [Alphaproteobacteria bacterium]